MYFIEKEIQEQPEIIQRLLNEEADNVAQIAQAIRDFDPVFVMIVARGTSDNAARYAQYLMGIHAKLPVALATPSVHTLYNAAPNLSRALVIGISQSGSSEDVRRVVADAREQGALTLSITNNPASVLANASTYHLPLHCEEEISVSATKTYTAELTAVAMLVTALIQDQSMQQDLLKLPDFVAQTLKLSSSVESWVQRYRYIERIAVLGRGYNYATAYEISLKVKELSYIPGEQYSEADFRHGPIAIIEKGFPVIAVAPQGQTLPLMLDLLQKLQAREAECLVITNDEEAARYAQFAMQIPSNLPEWLSPICAVIPGQFFAMHLAIVKGLPVDTPQGLQKVTITH